MSEYEYKDAEEQTTYYGHGTYEIFTAPNRHILDVGGLECYYRDDVIMYDATSGTWFDHRFYNSSCDTNMYQIDVQQASYMLKEDPNLPGRVVRGEHWYKIVEMRESNPNLER
jgi:hypothetical protein